MVSTCEFFVSQCYLFSLTLCAFCVRSSMATTTQKKHVLDDVAARSSVELVRVHNLYFYIVACCCCCFWSISQEISNCIQLVCLVIENSRRFVSFSLLLFVYFAVSHLIFLQHKIKTTINKIRSIPQWEWFSFLFICFSEKISKFYLINRNIYIEASYTQSWIKQTILKE